MRSPPSLVARCACIGLIAALPVAFNAWVDPARVLGAPTAERAIADALLAGHAVTDVMNYDDRAIGRALALGRATRPDILALGSSRLQALRAPAFAGLTFANGAVSGGRLDEALGMYALFDSPERRPARVILNLDPLTLDDDGAWRSLATERASMLARIGIPNSLARDRAAFWVGTFKRLASPEYFRLSVFSLRTYGPAGIRYKVTDDLQNIEKTKTPDGSLVFAATSPEKRSRDITRFLADFHATEHLASALEDATLVERERVLEKFLAYMGREGVNVTVVLVPFHPRVYAELGARWYAPMELRYRAVAARAGAHVVGSYDPRLAGATDDDFFDESHMKPEPLARLVLAR